MKISRRVKEELENRVQRIEDLIGQRGVGSAQLSRAKKAQRNMNLAIVLGGAITVAGLLAWALSRGNRN